jgi:hypothetical protein
MILSHQFMKVMMDVYSISIDINDSPEKDNNEEEGCDSSDGCTIHNLVQFVNNENTKSSKEDESDQPRPNHNSVGVQESVMTVSASIIHKPCNNDEDNNKENCNVPHFYFMKETGKSFLLKKICLNIFFRKKLN